MTIIVAVLIYVRKKCCVESKSSDSSIPNRNRSASTQNLIEGNIDTSLQSSFLIINLYISKYYVEIQLSLLFQIATYILI